MTVEGSQDGDIVTFHDEPEMSATTYNVAPWSDSRSTESHTPEYSLLVGQKGLPDGSVMFLLIGILSSGQSLDINVSIVIVDVAVMLQCCRHVDSRQSLLGYVRVGQKGRSLSMIHGEIWSL